MLAPPIRVLGWRQLSLVWWLTVAGTVHGQAPTGNPVVDSSDAAQRAWLRGVEAYKAGALPVAEREFRHAALAWPVQPGYLWARVASAAALRDTAEVIAGLQGYVSIGVGRRVVHDSLLAPFEPLAAYQALVMRLADNIAPLPASRPVGAMRDSTFWPEGVDYDPKTGNFYLASVRHRTVAELRPDGSVRELWPRDLPTVGAVMGVRVDTVRGVLWATMSGMPQMEGFQPGDSALAGLLRVRISDGHIDRRWDLPPAPHGHALGDLTVGPNGDVYLTDSSHPVLYRLRPGQDTLEHQTHPLFRSLQGMAASPDGSTLFVADYLHGLLTVNLDDGTVTRLADAAGSTSLGCDGIVLDRFGAIIAIQNGMSPARVTRFTVSPDRRRILRADVLDRNTALADEPAIGTIAKGEFVYVANGQWEKYDQHGVRKADATLTPPLLLGFPLPSHP